MKAALALVWITLIGIAIPANAAEPADGYAGSLFKRQVVVVSDMNRALTLYRDLLGFQLDGPINASESTSYTYDMMEIPRNARLRTASLNAGKRQIRTLLLLEVSGIPVPALSGPRRSATVVNANGRCKTIIAAVGKLGLPLKAVQVLDSVDPADGRGVEQAFQDWDGNVVLLYEFPKR